MNLLVVDDETSLLQLLGQHLERQGHTIEPAASVAAALAAIAKPVTFDVALVDWKLPDGIGLDVARALLTRDAKARVIFTSGYPIDSSDIPAEFRSRIRMLQKPFLPRALAEMLKTLE
ncbi:MAG TPA: response regulator [Bryobacteraceae bacterium]|jgi:DNA-binding NtrC family response regulator